MVFLRPLLRWRIPRGKAGESPSVDGSAPLDKRSTPALEGLREIIKNKLADRKFESAHGFLEQLLDDASAWEFRVR